MAEFGRGVLELTGPRLSPWNFGFRSLLRRCDDGVGRTGTDVGAQADQAHKQGHAADGLDAVPDTLCGRRFDGVADLGLGVVEDRRFGGDFEGGFLGRVHGFLLSDVAVVGAENLEDVVEAFEILLGRFLEGFTHFLHFLLRFVRRGGSGLEQLVFVVHEFLLGN